MGIKLHLLDGKEPEEIVTYFIDFSRYGADLVLTNPSSTIYKEKDISKTDISSLHPWTPVVSGLSVYQTVTLGTDKVDYVWELTVTAGQQLFVEQAKYLVKEI